MSNEIQTAFVQTYMPGIEMLAQQMESRIARRVRQEREKGKRIAFDQVGAVAARQRTVRHADTEYVNTPHRKRWVSMTDWHVADLLDWQDLLRILNNPGSAYDTAFMSAMRRAQDAVTVTAALGTVFTGEEGTTPVTLPAGQQIANGGTGFTFDKLRQAVRILKSGNAVDGNERPIVCWTAKQEEAFINTTEVKSSDFNNQKVLVDGELRAFYGCDFVRAEDWTDELGATNRILPFAGGVRTCVVMMPSGVLFNEPGPPMPKVDQLPNKQYSWQHYIGAQFGACRMQEVKVVQLDATEA